jgi:hypothetical protein
MLFVANPEEKIAFEQSFEGKVRAGPEATIAPDGFDGPADPGEDVSRSMTGSKTGVAWLPERTNR